MSKRSQHRDPADPMPWIGQPSTPHDPYACLNPGRFHWAQKTYIFFGCLLMGTFALTWAALIAVGLIQTNGPAFWALLILIGARPSLARWPESPASPQRPLEQQGPEDTNDPW